jgi:hypothetical protein
VSREQRMVLSLHLPAFPSHSEVFGTARSRPGRAVCARRRKIFSGFEKIFRSGPWTARTVLERGAEGKAGGGLRGCPPGGGPGQRRAPYRARFLRAASSNPRAVVSHGASKQHHPQALLLCGKLANSFCLAFCITSAALVSVWARACRSSSATVTPDLSCRAKSGS